MIAPYFQFMPLLVCAVAVWRMGAVDSATADPEVQLIGEMRGWERAWTHEALEPLYNASLYPDIKVFQERVRLPSALGIANQLKKYHLNNTRVKRGTAVVLVRGGRLQGLTFSDFNPAYRIRLDSVVSELQRHQDAGHIKLEDTIFILNTRDVPVCLLGYCLAPLFSVVKEFRNDRAYSDDLLVPLMAYPQEEIVYYPPEKKIRKGVLASYKGEATGSESSCRSLVHRFAGEELAGQYISVLDSQSLFKGHAGGAQAGAGAAGGAGQGAVSGIAQPPPPPEQMSQYWTVLSCDCQTANPGLASLLHTNSLVLKGRSFWYEYFYRALQNEVHYREFEPGFAFEAVKEVLKPSSTKKVKAIVEAGQRFAYKYLSMRSRALYYEKTISEYNKLFGPGYMQATVADLPTHRPLTMEDILQLRMYPSSWRQGLA